MGKDNLIWDYFKFALIMIIAVFFGYLWKTFDFFGFWWFILFTLIIVFLYYFL